MGTLASVPASPGDPPAPVDPDEAAAPLPALVELVESPPAPELLVVPFDAPPFAPPPLVVALVLLPHAHRPALSTADTQKNARVDFMCDR
jgi:hypothetical protein